MILRVHYRLLVGIALGLIAWWVAGRLGAPHSSRPLIGWNLGAAIYLVSTWWLFVSASEDAVRDASRYDEPRIVIIVLAVAAVCVAFGGILASLAPTPGQAPGAKQLALILAAVTLVSCWFVMQTLFVGHYARRHYQDVAEHGDAGGFLFPGNPPTTYLDFAYLALCVGATAQVSDPGVKTRSLRNLVTAHAVTAFFYNTAVLAMGINILSGLIGH